VAVQQPTTGNRQPAERGRHDLCAWAPLAWDSTHPFEEQGKEHQAEEDDGQHPCRRVKNGGPQVAAAAAPRLRSSGSAAAWCRQAGPCVAGSRAAEARWWGEKEDDEKEKEITCLAWHPSRLAGSGGTGEAAPVAAAAGQPPPARGPCCRPTAMRCRGCPCAPAEPAKLTMASPYLGKAVDNQCPAPVRESYRAAFKQSSMAHKSR
jgi:hypothetical protein